MPFFNIVSETNESTVEIEYTPVEKYAKAVRILSGQTIII